nr:MAG TPA: hypothetical protein [Caudoviricetes sp.]
MEISGVLKIKKSNILYVNCCRRNSAAFLLVDLH